MPDCCETLAEFGARMVDPHLRWAKTQPEPAQGPEELPEYGSIWTPLVST